MKRRVELHVSSGLGWIFTYGGTKAIEHKIDSRPGWGVDAKHHFHWQVAGVADKIIERRDEHGDDPLVILGGMSWGCLVMQQACVKLGEHGIRVHKLFGMDPTALPYNHPPMQIPLTVDETWQFWSTRAFFNFPLAARRRDPTGGRGGMYTFAPGYPKDKRHRFDIPTGHLGVPRHARTVQVIMDELEESLS